MQIVKCSTKDITLLAAMNKCLIEAFWKSIGFAEICVSMRYGEKTKMKKLGCRGSA